jgi:hypothetical protein
LLAQRYIQPASHLHRFALLGVFEFIAEPEGIDGFEIFLAGFFLLA